MEWPLAILLGAGGYTYVAYPAALALLARRRPRRSWSADPPEWPFVSIILPVYNEAEAIAAALAGILALDYPADRREVIVVSDASTDGTDAIVRSFAPRGVRLVSLTTRGGKTVAEAAAGAVANGAIVVALDASSRIRRDALKAIVRPFADPTVGVASGCDVSLSPHAEAPDQDVNAGEGTYVGYEMQVRELETRLSGIVGASGCFYASRTFIYRAAVPAGLSRDFGSALIARERGLSAVSVPDAVCYVTRAPSLAHEYRRKVRTMARGLRTLWHWRRLLNPLDHPAFAWMLWSHKVCRWLLPWAMVAAAIALVWYARTDVLARVVLASGIAGAALGLLGWLGADRVRFRLARLGAYALLGAVASLHAWGTALLGPSGAVWQPTRRTT